MVLANAPLICWRWLGSGPPAIDRLVLQKMETFPISCVIPALSICLDEQKNNNARFPMLRHHRVACFFLGCKDIIRANYGAPVSLEAPKCFIRHWNIRKIYLRCMSIIIVTTVRCPGPHWHLCSLSTMVSTFATNLHHSGSTESSSSSLSTISAGLLNCDPEPSSACFCTQF